MYLGIDVSKATLDVALLVEPEARKPRHRVFQNTSTGHHQLLVWLQEQGAGGVHVCLEATVSRVSRDEMPTEREILSGLHGSKARGLLLETLERPILLPEAGIAVFPKEFPFSIECPNPGCRRVSCVPGIMPFSALRRRQAIDPENPVLLLWKVPPMASHPTTE